MKNCIIIAFLTIILAGCLKETWSGFYYPNKDNLTVDEYLGDFSSLEECRQAAHKAMGSNKNADYECGLNCDRSKGKPFVCEKTER